MKKRGLLKTFRKEISFMKELMFFDANARVGDTMMGPRPGVKKLLEEMDRYGVEKALVRHGNVDTLGAFGANRDLGIWLTETVQDRLYGVWNILPEQCDELPLGEELFKAMKRNQMKALAVNDAHRFVMCRMSIGKIMDAAAERKIPVLLHGIQSAWKNVYDFVKEFPGNRVIINSGQKWGSDRNLRPLLENCENLYVELAGYWVPEGIRDLAELYTSKRIMYGSGFPVYAHGSAMAQIKHSGLTDQQIADIAGLNMVKLMEESEI